MKKMILSLILAFTLINNVFASNVIKERNIDSFETVLVNVPSKVIYHYSPIYSFAIRLEDNNEFSITDKDLIIKNINGKLGIDVKNLNRYDLDNFYDASPDNIIINIYAPNYPEIKTTSRNLWISNNNTNKKISTTYAKN